MDPTEELLEAQRLRKVEGIAQVALRLAGVVLLEMEAAVGQIELDPGVVGARVLGHRIGLIQQLTGPIGLLGIDLQEGQLDQRLGPGTAVPQVLEQVGSLLQPVGPLVRIVPPAW